MLRQRVQQFAELTAEHHRLSNLLSQATTAPVEDGMAELAKLRGEADALRKRTNEIARQLTENRQSAKEPARSKSITPVRQPGNTWVVSDSDSEEYLLQLWKLAAGERNRYTGDARNLTWAVLEYARQHNSQLPSTFAEAEPYKWKGEPPLARSFKERDTMAGANDFEIVYDGSLNELTNIPNQAVALLRQRQPWRTPNGKWARIYTMANGFVYAVESEDNFKSWESEHVVPPTMGQ